MKVDMLQQTLREIKEEPHLMLDDNYMQYAFNLSEALHELCESPVKNKPHIEFLRDVYEEFSVDASHIYNTLFEADQQIKKDTEWYQASLAELQKYASSMLSAMDEKVTLTPPENIHPKLEQILKREERITERINNGTYTAKDYANTATLFEKEVPAEYNYSQQTTIPFALSTLLNMYEDAIITIEDDVFIWYDTKKTIPDWDRQKTEAIAEKLDYEPIFREGDTYTAIQLFNKRKQG
ncbi:MAG: hypothetical protein ACLFP2_04780 [Candidatus Woesearchaeota archaeon]